MSERTVHCKKLGLEAPGLLEPPFGGSLGQEIYEHISAQAWAEWRDNLMIKVINEYRLNLADPEQYEVLIQQMRTFLNLVEGNVLEVENEKRGRSDQ